MPTKKKVEKRSD